MRVGLGHDTHRLVDGTDFVLGGVRISHSRSLYGHSDADVLLHAITDAVLGAAGLGDIGELFPDTDPANRGRSSVEMLRIAYEQVRQKGYGIVNLDCIVFAEKPKLGPMKQAIRQSIADILALPLDRVNVKAKTGERVGFLGREEAISAEAVVLLIGDR